MELFKEQWGLMVDLKRFFADGHRLELWAEQSRYSGDTPFP
jgi:hypothetical protein